MADQEKVAAETENANVITEPVLTIGHTADGAFMVATHGVNWFIALAALEHARNIALSQINPNKPRKVIPIAGRIPPLAQANGRH